MTTIVVLLELELELELTGVGMTTTGRLELVLESVTMPCPKLLSRKKYTVASAIVARSMAHRRCSRIVSGRTTIAVSIMKCVWNVIFIIHQNYFSDNRYTSS